MVSGRMTERAARRNWFSLSMMVCPTGVWPQMLMPWWVLGRHRTAATAMEWWRSLTRRKRIFSLTPLIVSSMQSVRRASKTVST